MFYKIAFCMGPVCVVCLVAKKSDNAPMLFYCKGDMEAKSSRMRNGD